MKPEWFGIRKKRLMNGNILDDLKNFRLIRNFFFELFAVSLNSHYFCK